MQKMIAVKTRSVTVGTRNYSPVFNYLNEYPGQFGSTSHGWSRWSAYMWNVIHALFLFTPPRNLAARLPRPSIRGPIPVD